MGGWRAAGGEGVTGSASAETRPLTGRQPALPATQSTDSPPRAMHNRAAQRRSACAESWRSLRSSACSLAHRSVPDEDEPRGLLAVHCRQGAGGDNTRRTVLRTRRSSFAARSPLYVRASGLYVMHQQLQSCSCPCQARHPPSTRLRMQQPLGLPSFPDPR